MRKEIGKVGEYEIHKGETVIFIDKADENRPYKAKVMHIKDKYVKLIVFDFEGGGNPPQNCKITTTLDCLELDTMTIIKKVMKDAP